MRVQSPSLDSLVLGNKRLSSHVQQSPGPDKVPRGPGDGLEQGAAMPGPAQANRLAALLKVHKSSPVERGPTSQSRATSDPRPAAGAATEGAGGPQLAAVQQSVADLSALSISATGLPPASNAAKHAEGSGSKPTALVTVRADARAIGSSGEAR